MRNVISIQVVQESERQSAQLVALCDDGSMWLSYVGTAPWHRLEPIPQDDPADRGES